MLLFGCLIGLAIAFAPRIMLILAWLFGSRWDEVWQGNWLMPLLGIIFLPYTTVMYLLVWNSVTGISGWDWIWIILGVVLDISKWAQIANNRRGIPGYPQGAAAGAQQSAYVSPAGVGQPPAAEVAPRLRARLSWPSWPTYAIKVFSRTRSIRPRKNRLKKGRK
jgi:hypothetical protein